jgi:hypothetical protein
MRGRDRVLALQGREQAAGHPQPDLDQLVVGLLVNHRPGRLGRRGAALQLAEETTQFGDPVVRRLGRGRRPLASRRELLRMSL